jgi:hypothetical protein
MHTGLAVAALIVALTSFVGHMAWDAHDRSTQALAKVEHSLALASQTSTRADHSYDRSIEALITARSAEAKVEKAQEALPPKGKAVASAGGKQTAVE